MHIDDLPAEGAMRRCADCQLNLGTRPGDTLRAAFACPLFGKCRVGVESRCASFVPKAVVAAAVLALSGCSLTPTQQKWAGFAAGVLVVGAIAAHDADSGKPPAGLDVRTPTVPCSDAEACR